MLLESASGTPQPIHFSLLHPYRSPWCDRRFWSVYQPKSHQDCIVAFIDWWFRL